MEPSSGRARYSDTKALKRTSPTGGVPCIGCKNTVTVLAAVDWINHLGLVRHPEGGHYREIYRSPEQIPQAGLPGRFPGPRHLSTSIYFLLEGKDRSRFHRLKSDEVWHFYTGSSLTLHVLTPEGDYRMLALGPKIISGEQFQAILPAGHWFGATVNRHESFSLIGCTLAPGFDFKDFELGRQEELLRLYPKHAALIRRLT